MKANILLIFLFGALVALFVESLFFEFYYRLTKKHYKEHHYTFSRYIFFLTFPLISTFLVVYYTGWTAFTVFVSFALIGTLGEWIVGWAYYHIVGQRLWTYHRFAITKNTSFLVIPLWGFAGILFWSVARVFV